MREEEEKRRKKRKGEEVRMDREWEEGRRVRGEEEGRREGGLRVDAQFFVLNQHNLVLDLIVFEVIWLKEDQYFLNKHF